MIIPYIGEGKEEHLIQEKRCRRLTRMLPALIRLLIFPLASLPDSSPGPMRRWSTEMITKVHYPEELYQGAGGTKTVLLSHKSCLTDFLALK